MSNATPKIQKNDWTLYHYWRSSSSWRVRWALELKGIAVTMVPVGLLDGEVEREPHLSRNPMGHVPVLQVESRYLIESMAILEWLDEKVPTPSLFPGDSFQRAHIRALCELINSGVQPIQNLSVLDQVSQDPARREQWSQHFIRKGLAAFEKLVAPTAGLSCVGNNITAADLVLIPQCYNAKRNQIDLAEFPLIQRIHDAAMATPACQASAPERFDPSNTP